MSKDKETEADSQAFKVVDHRRFNPDGSEKDEKTPLPDTSEEAFRPEPAPESAEPVNAREEEAKISFSDLVLSLAASAQIHLGVSTSPFSGKVEKDLPQAAQNIDLLGVLAEKTRGNLTQEEGQLLEAILADLRMRFVEESKKR